MRTTRWVSALALIGTMSIADACGGSEGPDGSAGASAVATAPPRATLDATAAPSAGARKFPVPIVEGGEIVSEFPGEVTIAYPEALFDRLVSFYESYALERGGAGGEMSLGGINYQFEDAGATIDLSVTPQSPQVIVFIRVLP